MATIKSIEEKATRYDEALKEAVVAHKDEDKHLKATLERIFPELKESEDEKIMKALYKMAKVPRKEIYEAEGITKEQALAWLEKQGEQKLTEFEKAVKQVMEEAIECGDTHNLKADAEMLLSLAHKSADKVKPRYNIGDVLCDKSCTTLNKDAQPNFEILDIKDGVYICDNGSIPISQQDNYELVAKKIEQNLAWSEEDSVMLGDLVFSINEESIIEDLKRRGIDCNLDTATCIKKRLIAWIKTFKDRLYPQLKQEWSEEDEKMYNTVHNLAWEAYKRNRQLDTPTFGTINHWFKALKDRVILQSKLHWEQSDSCK